MTDRNCSVEGCGPVSGQYRRGMCGTHYHQAWRASGDAKAKATKHNAASARWLEANRDRRNAKGREWRQANPDKVRQHRVQWGAANPERLRELRRANEAARKARKRATQADRVDYAQILIEHGMVCHICGGEISGRNDLHFDHVIPLARGGEHSAANIRPSHARCNLQKGPRLIAG